MSDTHTRIHTRDIFTYLINIYVYIIYVCMYMFILLFYSVLCTRVLSRIDHVVCNWCDWWAQVGWWRLYFILTIEAKYLSNSCWQPVFRLFYNGERNFYEIAKYIANNWGLFSIIWKKKKNLKWNGRYNNNITRYTLYILETR